jgi:hypothetical protein
MFLISTLRNFANDLTPETGLDRYQAMLASVRVERLKLDARDRVRSLLPASCDTIDVVRDADLTEALNAAELGGLEARIRARAPMITPVDEREALSSYEHRHSRTGGNV